MQRKALLATVIGGTLMLAGCGFIPIGRVTADPSRYMNRTVHVSGRVTNSFGILGTGGYQVEDRTGKIYVISGTGVPSKGAQVEVTGQVMNGIEVGGRPIGTAIRESHHRVRW